MKHTAFRLLCFILLITQLSLFNSGQTKPDAASQPLEQGKPIERELKGGEVHVYSVQLKADQFLNLIVDQRGIDVVVLLFAPDGKQLAEVDSPNGTQGPEPVSLLSKTTGDFRVEIRSLEKDAAAGRYEIKIEELRDANLQDKTNDLAARLAAAKTDEESAALLAAQRELVTPALAQALHKEGVVLFNSNDDHQQQLFVFGLVLKLGEQLDDNRARALGYSGLGAVNESLEKHALAAEYHLKSVALLEQLDDKPRLAQSYANVGHAYRFKGEYARALEYYQKSVRLFEEIGNKRGLVSELNDVALSYNLLGNQPAAVETFQKSLAVLETFDFKQLKVHTLGLLGYTYFIQGRYSKALEAYRASLQLAEELRWTPRIIDLHGFIGSANYKQGNYALALESFQKALNLAEASQNRQKYAMVSLDIGDVLFSQGNPAQATEFYQRGLRLLESIKDSFGYGAMNDRAAMSHALNRLGEIQAAQENFPSALEHYKKSLQLLESIPTEGYAEGMVALLNNMGDLHAAQGKHTEALTYYQKALAFSEKIGVEFGIANSLTNIANVFYLQNDHAQSLKSAARAIEIAQRIGDREALWTALTITGKVQRALNKPEEARQAFTNAITIIESLRLNVAGQQARASYFAGMQEPFEQYVELLMEMHARRPSEKFNVIALEISERQRARSLLESLNEARADIRQGVDAKLLQREREVREQLNAKAENQTRLLNDMSARVTQPLGGNEREERAAILKKEITALTAEYQNIEAQIRQQSPRYAALTQPQPLTLSEIQQQILDRDTVLLEYSLGEKKSYLWLVTKDSTKSYELPPRSEIEATVKRVYALVSDGKLVVDDKSQSEYEREAARLGEILLAPVAPQLKNKRVLLVADGALQYLPFGALPSPTTKNQPLIVENEIISLPSASTLVLLRLQVQGRTAASKTLAVFADPVFSLSDARVKVTNSTIQPTSLPQNTALERAASNTGVLREGVISRLPFSRREAESILAAVPTGEKMQALDFEANRTTALSSEISQYRILHFATHGLLNSEHPELSGIVLSLVNEQGQPIDGFLRLNEIYNLNLSADLVVLSACQTALGKEIKGEGLIGLTRGFMYAGSPRVVASLWKVDDAATAELMKRFYQKMLQEKMRPAAALRAAKLEMWKQKRWSAPFYWAAFELQGEWR
jgi:CHAT domain-containing protein/predicted negative regulator of RcsB-dependent stress response